MAVLARANIRESYYLNPEPPVLESLDGAFLLIYKLIAFNTFEVLIFISEAKAKSGEHL